ncbi:GCN5-like N-acetyltransferase [Novosphingobium sp. Rr 2-17]|uniref:GNAT family N-acetyltransferase n=1 Tax=Novosphingobium sp. Rr 2-17 TaxID=555793 RepID=UPI0002698178|nr:GNAT family N-acetyltransferase [Novosphingobium sp. Rr 2-17]EIZ81248.1 GCN5-like N-acetyltransferase [Novosphingobium sp. Rr 2-17]
MATDIEARVTLRRMTVDDLPAAQSLSSGQKWPHRVEDWDMLLGLGFGYVAQTDERIVGTAMAWLYGADAATLGMVIVSPHAGDTDTGRQLMDAVLGDLDGRTVLLNATAEGRPLYAGMGFEALGLVFQHQGAAFAVPIAELIPGERVRPLGAKDMPTLQALARRATGMDRDALLNALVPGAQGVVLTRDNEPVGFSLFCRFGRGHVVGPTVAPDTGGAKVLISHWLGSHAGIFCRIDIPEESGLGDWLEELGLPQVGQVTSMVRGRPPKADPSARTFTLTTQALG